MTSRIAAPTPSAAPNYSIYMCVLKKMASKTASLGKQLEAEGFRIAGKKQFKPIAAAKPQIKPPVKSSVPSSITTALGTRVRIAETPLASPALHAIHADTRGYLKVDRRIARPDCPAA